MSVSLLAAKLALGPILLPQARHVRRTALRLPEADGPRDSVAGHGEPVLRILVVGDSSAAGVGLADQAQALALPLAHRLRESLGGPVAWQLVARSGIDSLDARGMVAQAALAPADVLVTVLGVNDVTAQRSAADYTGNLGALWAQVRSRTGARWAVCCGLPPMGLLTAVPQPLRWYLGLYADRLDAEARRFTRAHGLGYCGLRFAADPSLLAPDGFHPGLALYPQWSRKLADIVTDGREQWRRA